MDTLFTIKEYFKYLIEAKSKYYIHSPFVFSFINDVLNDDRHFYCYDEVEKLRNQLLNDQIIIDVDDYGAGSTKATKKNLTVSSIAKSSAAPKKYSQLLFRIAKYYKCKNILELGTSLGISTSYLSAANHTTQVYSIEGSKYIATAAQKNFDELGRKNIHSINGTFDEKLLPVLYELKVIDLIYLDGNHRMKPTIDYFNRFIPHLHENSVVIIDDIYWSKEMKQAWNEIKNHSSVSLSIDLFRMGILFFKKERATQHFRLYY